MDTPNERIKQLRKESKLLQEDVAVRINSSRFNISRYENGIPVPSEVVAAYAQAFGVSADWILGLTTDRTPGGSEINTAIDALAAQAGKQEAAFSADQLMQLLDALRAYYRAGAPAGNAPMQVLSAFLTAMTDAVKTTRTGSAMDVLAATNALSSVGLNASTILAQFLRQQDEK